MKAYLHLLRYLTTWLQPVAWFIGLGLALLGIALTRAVIGDYHTAYGFTIYAAILALGVPYLFVWHPFRVLLASRRLALLPGFRLKLGVALLGFTLLLAASVPLASALLWPELVPPRFGLAYFIGASLFTFILQWAVASPHAILIYSLGPFALIYVGANAWPVLLAALADPVARLALTAVSALAWAIALWVMATRREFQPPGKPPTHVRDYIWDGRADWLGVLLGNYRGPVQTAGGTLLLGTPDGFSGRFFTMLNLVVVSPLVMLVLLYVTGIGQIADTPGAWAGTFLSFGLMTSMMAGFGNGELAARCRLVWLRQQGGRAEQWRRLERRLFADTQLLALIVVPIAGVAHLMFASITLDPLTYCLVTLAGNFLGNYFSLAARLSQWSLFAQVVIAVAMAASLVSGRLAGLLPLPLLLALLVGLALLFRQQARQRFAVVDWYQLRPATSALKGKLT